MQYQVFVQSESEQHFVASVLGIPNLTVEGKTEEEAICNIKSALEAQLAKGKFMTIEVEAPKEGNQNATWMKYAGIFASDPTFDDFMEKLSVIRKEANGTVDE
ncbi:hypothetical protein NIES4071_74210 [Calothrix sp. NIES-4071]|nr:hypothetical protein NIES4071_74210 [Calothrix sp. NIES-4071]BAZ61696.1 hypothetical protein NIES4105_74160 [Calothrix sp. NIES-4105]